MGLDFRVRRCRNRKLYLQPALESSGIRTSAAQLLKITYWSFRPHAKKHNLSSQPDPCLQGDVLSDVDKFRSETGHRTKRDNSL
jgi:hypothetical protein